MLSREALSIAFPIVSACSSSLGRNSEVSFILQGKPRLGRFAFGFLICCLSQPDTCCTVERPTPYLHSYPIDPCSIVTCSQFKKRKIVLKECEEWKLGIVLHPVLCPTPSSSRSTILSQFGESYRLQRQSGFTLGGSTLSHFLPSGRNHWLLNAETAKVIKI